jgi:hypothetical protein
MGRECILCDEGRWGEGRGRGIDVRWTRRRILFLSTRLNVSLGEDTGWGVTCAEDEDCVCDKPVS